MERIGTLLEKIKELNSKQNPALVEIDLMMDYTKVLYADLLEWRNKVVFTNNLIVIDENDVRIKNIVSEDSPEPITNPDIAAPAVELDNTSVNYEATVNRNKPQNTFLETPHYSDADIRQHIGINDKYQFISELFGNNKEAYEEVLSELNTFDTEKEAITWINSTVTKQWGWKDDMEAVQSFYKLLSEFFASR